MSNASVTDASTDQYDELERFTHDFFTLYGADVCKSVTPHGLKVRLPAALVTHFGKEKLHLIFQHSRQAGDFDLVAYGSRTFDRILSYLATGGAVTTLQLPARFAGGEELLQAVRPVNAAISQLKMSEETQHLFLFHWRLTYRADDKREEIYPVLLAADGTFIALQNGGNDHQERDEPTAIANIDLDSLLHDAESSPKTRDVDGEAGSIKLPPMTQLTRLAEIARRYAIYHADLQCVDHEAEVIPRLHKTLARLTSYYEQQISEIYDSHDPDGRKRTALEAELVRKQAEEVENHRLHVQVRLFGYAVLQLPVAVADMTLTAGDKSIAARVLRNLYDGRLQRPACDACGQEVGLLALDRNGHVTCDDCVRQCQSCLEILCAECGVETCPVCTIDTCAECGHECWACGARACPDHMDICPICEDSICHGCQSECGACGTLQCRSHMYADCIPNRDGSSRLICRACAVRCPGCRQFSAEVELCSATGQRFCAGCLKSCVTCGRKTGPGYYRLHPHSRQPVCLSCAEVCSTCGDHAAITLTCDACETSCCPACAAACSACGVQLCPEHGVAEGDCGHILCARHDTVCAIGSERVCPGCRQPCSICDRPFCMIHAATCERCRMQVCQECVRLSGLCDLCATVDKEGEFVALLDEPCANDRRVLHLQPHYRWVRICGVRHTLYLGRDRGMQAAIIVIDDAEPVPQVRLARKLGMLDTPHRDRWLAP